jgi:uncharacterized protein (TIGR03083 family)
VDYVAHFRREVAAFEAAARAAVGMRPAPAVPACPGWRVTNLVLHLGTVHRYVARVIAERLAEPPPPDEDPAWLAVPGECAGWLAPGAVPGDAALPAALVNWFAAAAADLRAQFQAAGPDVAVWTWSADHTVGFWQRMQAIEAAVHRWDAQAAAGGAEPVDAELAADAIGQTFEIMAPMRRALKAAPPGQGERFAFRRTDGTERWNIRFDGAGLVPHDGPGDVELSGTASDLMLFLWQRISADAAAGDGRLTVRGDVSLLDRYFVLVPPV